MNLDKILNDVTMDYIKGLIKDYAKKHRVAVDCGSEYIWQSDEGTVDIIEMGCSIFDYISERNEGI